MLLRCRKIWTMALLALAPSSKASYTDPAQLLVFKGNVL
jgi:hypothetical protein